MHDFKIPVYIINLKERIDRQTHILNEFKDKPEFEIFLFEAIRDAIGAVGLWKSITAVVKLAKEKGEDLIIICEDDHQFTENYNYNQLLKNIERGERFGANILLGGISWFDYMTQVHPNLFWINSFNATQFVIMYSSFFDCILNATFDAHENADFKIAELTESKYVMFPFVSVQREFGYSDVTSRNSEEGYVNELFIHSELKLDHMDTVRKFYNLKF
ncbi:hypothetical protein HMPREF0765_2084 [Sphingobacterium spiritivorum ATCC 33300]|uniref:LPS glycosyltransferase n=1 Tax=Sphingobacterium spiritivorum ATCC 33300 TaxID=525372 RepID=C2FXM8_SPHSI|nr:hypothetical protein [Sphingobacterium spiritivorum]EEI92469.1 hypothetical protein HMPREF0765_2084 [Sphingobacterium spiritivorum ATCC 33300]QQS96791.1 glycosyl transferase [Sphingobacterium spiritivorum]